MLGSPDLTEVTSMVTGDLKEDEKERYLKNRFTLRFKGDPEIEEGTIILMFS